MTLLLILETSIRGVGVGIASMDSQKLIWSNVHAATLDSAKLLPSMIREGFKANQLNDRDLAGIVLSRGPGSFTGLRVGCAYALGLAAGVSARTGRDMRWLGVSALGLLAKSQEETSNRVSAVALAATKTTGYLAMSKNSEETLIPIHLDTVRDHMVKIETLTIIDQWDLLRDCLPETHIDGISAMRAIEESLLLMNVVAQKSWPHEFTIDLPSPHYLRKSSVEEQELKLKLETNTHGL